MSSEGGTFNAPLSLPQRTRRVAIIGAGASHLQWRDRAGITPDFPVTPLRAPERLFNDRVTLCTTGRKVLSRLSRRPFNGSTVEPHQRAAGKSGRMRRVGQASRIGTSPGVKLRAEYGSMGRQDRGTTDGQGQPSLLEDTLLVEFFEFTRWIVARLQPAVAAFVIQPSKFLPRIVRA